MAKLIVIEGTDASGKQTQSELLYEYLKGKNTKVMKLIFPDYESRSSELVKMYLEGCFGKDAESVDPKIASVFYAADRYASYKTKWEEFARDENAVIILDRYVTSNMIHQAAKIDDPKAKEEYLNWIYDFEYNIMGLPKPDYVIFLNMRFDLAEKLMANRNNKITDGEEKDIHESNKEYMLKCYNNACGIARKYSWHEVKCFREDTIRTIEDIQHEIRDLVCN